MRDGLITSGSVISNCNGDENARSRQEAAWMRLFGIKPTLVNVQNNMAAAGNLVDQLDIAATFGEGPALILVNSYAHRDDRVQEWENGVPFGVCHVEDNEDAYVISTLNGEELSLVKKLGLVKKISILDVPTVMDWAVKNNVIRSNIARIIAEDVKRTQFRSLKFAPRFGFWMLRGYEPPVGRVVDIDEIYPHEPPLVVWWPDQPFKNCKTTLVKADLNKPQVKHGPFGGLKFYDRLSDVPRGQAAWVEGSSGYSLTGQFFLELVIQGKQAGDQFGLDIGSLVASKLPSHCF